MDTPILRAARQKLDLPIGKDLGESEVHFPHVFKRAALEEFHNEVIGLVQMQRRMADRAMATARFAAPAFIQPRLMTGPVLPAKSNIAAQGIPLEQLMY